MLPEDAKGVNTDFMQTPTQIVEAFYTAFQQQDAEAMAQLYHPDIHFSDPVFTDLHGAAAGDMWRMLIGRAKGQLDISFGDIQMAGDEVTARWEARYLFSKTKRPVHNIIQARFQFKDGLIIRHIDDFSFPRWAGMALGLTGKLLGWTSFLRRKVQQQSMAFLKQFQEQKA